MLRLINMIYRLGLDLLAWVILIGSFIVGGLSAADFEGFSLAGAIGGLIGGFLVNLLVIGPLSTFIELSNDVKNIKAKLYNENSPVESPSRVSILCPSCNARIRHDDAFCQNCGKKLG